MTDLTELAAKVESAEGASRELDAQIAAAVYMKQLTYLPGEWIKDPEFTTSLDAALTLVPEHTSTDLFIAAKGTTRCTLAGNGDEVPDTDKWESIAATPALALTAAALRARAPQGES